MYEGFFSQEENAAVERHAVAGLAQSSFPYWCALILIARLIGLRCVAEVAHAASNKLQVFGELVMIPEE